MWWWLWVPISNIEKHWKIVLLYEKKFENLSCSLARLGKDTKSALFIISKTFKEWKPNLASLKAWSPVFAALHTIYIKIEWTSQGPDTCHPTIHQSEVGDTIHLNVNLSIHVVYTLVWALRLFCVWQLVPLTNSRKTIWPLKLYTHWPFIHPTYSDRTNFDTLGDITRGSPDVCL